MSRVITADVSRVICADGRIITPAQFVAEALHPSRWGNVQRVVIAPTFTVPAKTVGEG